MSKEARSINDPGSPLEQHVSTVDIVHRHSLEPTTKEKILIPVVLLLIGAVLVGVGIVVWDHMNRDYAPLRSPGDLVGAAQRPLPEPTGLAALLNPDDSRFRSLEVRKWDGWIGAAAVTQNHLLRLDGMKAESIESLVKGDRGAAALRFKIDLGRSQGSRFHVDEIVRGGMASGEAGVTLEVHPLTVANRPAVSTSGQEGSYVQSDNVAYDRDATFQSMKRFVAMGRLQKGEGGYWLQGKRFNVVLAGDLDPEFAAFLDDLANTAISERGQFFLDLQDVFPWTEKGKPGRRQTAHEIGSARIDGVLLGTLYIKNGP
jgi:hypothetical protein